MPVIIALIVKGLTAVIIQTIFIRELLVLFSGNELTIGIIFSSWIIFQSLGAGIIARKKLSNNYFFFSLFQSLIVIITSLSIVFLRNSRIIFNKLPGESFSIIGIIIVSAIALAPFCIIDGWIFKLGSSLAIKKNQKYKGVSLAYAFEAIGVILGTILFFIFLFAQIIVIEQVVILGLINLTSAVLITLKYQKCSKKRFTFVLTIIFLITIIVISLKTKSGINNLSESTFSNLFQGLEITENKNSEYANICVGLKDKQKTVFVNGQPTATIPYDNTRFNETFSHLALLEHDQPKHILLIGNYYGLIKEILKHNVEKIDYVELDPMLIDSFKKIAKEELQNKKVNIKINDPRAYMRNSIQNYDLIFINYLVSSSIQINRFYTQEFFSLLKNNLNKNSLLVLSCQGSESSYSPELKNINTHLLNTLIDSFRYIKVVPGLTNIILASDYKINLNADYLFDKLKRREIKTSFIDTGHLNLLLNKSREEWFWHSLKKNNTTKNLDLKPRLVLDNLLLWNTKSFPGLRSISLLIEKINFNAIFILLVIILSSGFITKRVRKGFTLEYIAISTAFSEMLLVLSLIIAMQVYFGVVYSKIILITTSFMAGLSFGTLHCYRNAERIKESPTIKLLEAGFILIAVAILIMFETKILINELSLYVIACSIGIIHGWEFPLINKIYLTIKPKSNISTIYAFELLGGFFAAAFTTTLLIPIIGIPKCIMLVIIIKIYSLLYLNRKKIN